MWETADSVDDDAQESPLKFFTIVVLADPANATGVIGGSASFSASFISNAPLTFFNVFWQIQTDGVNWRDLFDTPGYYSITTVGLNSTLTVSNLDNFLANKTSLKFRAVATNPTFGYTAATTAATLSIPIHTNWNVEFLAAGSAAVGDPVALPSFTSSAVAVGFSGPYTYAWSKVSGDAIAIVDATVQAPTFTMAAAPIGFYSALYRCTISNGSASVQTDPQYVFAFVLGAPASTTANPTTPPFSSSGGTITATGFPRGGVWQFIGQANYRIDPTGFSISFTNLASPSTDFQLTGAMLGGTGVTAYAWREAGSLPANDNQAALGGTTFLLS